MNTQITIRSICAAVLTVWAGTASALSLGPVTGSAVVGRPLELSAAIQLDEPGSGSGCVSAELLFGDRLVDSAKIQVNLTQDAARQVSHATISTTALVDEPFVTLLLRAGCARQSTRRYVLFSDAPKDEPIGLASASSLFLTGAPVLMPVTGNRQAASAGLAKAAKPHSATPPFRFPVDPALTAMRTAALRHGGRLQLAVWDPSSEQMPWLRASTALRSTPTADSAHRAAAAALWRALNAQPQDLLRTAERLRGLEGDVSLLRSLAAGHRLEISSARDSLQSDQRRGHANLLLVAVLAMLAGGGAAFFWHRSRRADVLVHSSTWYGAPEPLADADPLFRQEREPAPVALGPVGERERVVQPQQVVVKKEPLHEVPVYVPLEFTLPDPPAALPAAPAPQKPIGLNIDALNGAQQQSEFFVSLGQFDEAVAVLTAYLAESSEEPVLPFLELFRIYHALEMQAKYEDLRSTFRQTFGIELPSYAEYKDEHRELELYPVAVGSIAAAWPSKESQQVIEDLLFKKPQARHLLSLPAYRDLLWLYALGQEVVYSTGMPAGLQLLRDRALSNDHFILPWAVGDQDSLPELSLDRLNAIDVAPQLNAFAVDIDLTAACGGTSRHSGAEAPIAPEPKPEAPPLYLSVDSTDAFDAVMESQSRKHSR